MDWRDSLITLFVYICQKYQENLCAYCQRMSNNQTMPDFLDEEAITVYLFGIIQGHTGIKKIYKYTQEHLLDWFPDLPSYTAFAQRLNRFGSLFTALTEHILKDSPRHEVLQNIRMVDSMPIIIAGAKRSSQAKVASELADKGYCSSKGIYYYGVKLHILALKRPHKIPVPEYIGITAGSEHDLNAFRQVTPTLHETEIFADKAYIDGPEQERLRQEQQVDVYTPVKKKKNQDQLFLFDQLLSTAVSKIRQPIEALFVWIEEKTNIQTASKVRSYNGLIVHIFGKLAAAMFILALNP